MNNIWTNSGIKQFKLWLNGYLPWGIFKSNGFSENKIQMDLVQCIACGLVFVEKTKKQVQDCSQLWRGRSFLPEDWVMRLMKHYEVKKKIKICKNIQTFTIKCITCIYKINTFYVDFKSLYCSTCSFACLMKPSTFSMWGLLMRAPMRVSSHKGSPTAIALVLFTTPSKNCGIISLCTNTRVPLQHTWGEK